MIYFDNAASTWPKPEEVAEAMGSTLLNYGGNPGRGGHRLAVHAEEIISEARRQVAKLFQIKEPRNLFFYSSATQAMNQALKGLLLQPGDHVITTSWEHHAVVRPLEELKQKRGIKVTYLPPNQWSTCPSEVLKAILPETKLIVTIHGSNVTGALTPIAEIGEIARQHGIPYLVDAAQTAGVIPIDVEALAIDMLAFPGHKGLLGPQGTGGLYVHPDLPLTPLIQGGTGSHSEEILQPADRPKAFESGTPNTPGIAGLLASVLFIQKTGIRTIYDREITYTKGIRDGLSRIPGTRIYGPERIELPVLSFNIEGVDPQEAAIILDREYNIAVRAGYHCASLAHRSLGTLDHGTIRVSPGFFNTDQELEQFLIAVNEVSEAFGNGF